MVGGLAYLASLPGHGAVRANLSYYANIVYEKFRLRNRKSGRRLRCRSGSASEEEFFVNDVRVIAEIGRGRHRVGSDAR